MRTHFAFEVQMREDQLKPGEASGKIMPTLDKELQAAFAKQDARAIVTASDGHKGPNHRLVEIICNLKDEDIASITSDFATQHGLTFTPLE